jgi:hypothetical protein
MLNLLKGGEMQMDIKELTKQQGMFMKAEDVKANPNAEFKITSEGEFVDNERFKKRDFHLKGTWNDEERILNCNKTNARIIEARLGSNSANWVNKTLKLETYKTRTTDGKLVDSINVADVLDENKQSIPEKPQPAQ